MEEGQLFLPNNVVKLREWTTIEEHITEYC